MDGLYKGKLYEFDNDFKNLPMENRVKLIHTAKSLLDVQKASRDNAPIVVLPVDVEKQGLSYRWRVLPVYIIQCRDRVLHEDGTYEGGKERYESIVGNERQSVIG
jgi:hypothetical protein